MNIYLANYSEHACSGAECVELPYRQRRIVVLAESQTAAEEKIKQCLAAINTGSCVAALLGKVKQCDGLQIVDGINSTNVLPIEIKDKEGGERE